MVTQRRDLRTGPPLWLARGKPRVPQQRLRENLRVDVAVVGAGVSGLLVSHALRRAGRDVAVFDRRGAARGSTPASTALLQFELDTPLTLLTRKIGRDAAIRAYLRSATAVDALRGLVADLDLRCAFRERHVAYLPGNLLDVAGLRREAKARAEIGLRSTFLSGPDLAARTGIKAKAAIWSAGAAEFDPAAFSAGLARALVAGGASIYAPVEITAVDPGSRSVGLVTREGHHIRASHCVFATGYELMKLIKPRGYRVHSTWAFATEPQPKRVWPTGCLIWQAADPYLYLRTTPDGRVVAGGEDEDFDTEERRDALIDRKVAAIGRKVTKILPGIDIAPAYRWTGSFGGSRTGLPAIGAIPGAPGCYAVLGFGGNGITFSMIAAQILQRAILGIPDPDAGLFALPR